MSNYNKVKNEGVEEYEKKVRTITEDKRYVFTINYLSTFADKIKKAVEEDISEEIKHDYRKLLDGFAHSKDCEFCKAEITLKP